MKATARTTNRRGRVVLKNSSVQKGRESVLPRQYQAIFKNTGKPMVIVEEDATISLANDEFEKLSGYTKEEIEGKKSWTEFVARGDRKRVKEYHHLRRSDPMLAPRCFEFRFLDRHGTAKNIVLTIGTIPGTQKSMASLQDVTDRRREEASLRVSEERYHTLFENSRDAFYITTSDGAYLDANQAALDLFGYTRKEMRKVNARKLYADPADAQRFQQEIKEKGFVRDFEVKLRKKDGTVMDCLFTVTAQRADDGGILEYQGIVRDITERKQMEKKLQQNEERYRTLVEKVDFGVNLIDTEYNIVMANAEQSKRMHKPVSELIGKKCFREFEKRDAVCPHCPGVKTLASSQPAEAETEAVRDDGSRFHVRLQTFPISGQDGTASGFIEVIEDITERKRAEKKIERLAFFPKLNPMPIVEVTPKGHFTYANPAAQHLFPDLGKRQDEHPFLAGLKPYFAKLRKKRETYVMREVEAGGGWYSQVIVLVDPEHIRIYSTDITERKQMEEELRESEERFKMLAEDAPFGISIMAPDRSFEYLNPRFTKIFGYTIEDIPDKDTWFKKAYPDRAYRNKVISIWKQDAAEEIKIGDENLRVFTVRCKDGQDKIIDFRSVDLKDGKQYLVYEDITVRAKAEEALKQSEERYRVLVENVKLGINLIDADHTIIMVNAAQEKYFKKSRAHFVGKKCFHEFEKRDAVCPHCPAVRAMATKKPAEVETVLTADDGSHFHVRIQVFPIFGKDGTVTSFIEIAENITERKQAEKLLQQEKETFYTILQNALYGVALMEADGKHVYVNPEFTAITGYTLEDIPTGKDWMHKAYPDKKYRQEVTELWRRDSKLGGTRRVVSIVCKDGETKETETSRTPLENGLSVVMLTDITERKRTEELLLQEKENFSTILQNALYGVGLIDRDGRYLYVNPEFTKITGYTLKDIPTGKDWMHKAFPDKEYRQKVIEAWKKDSASGGMISREFRVVCKDEGIKDIEFRPTQLIDGRAIVMFADITERKQMEEDLRESEERFKMLAEEAPFGISIMAFDRIFEYLNPMFTKMFGYTKEDVPDKDTWFAKAYPDEEYRKKVSSTWNRVVAEDVRLGEENPRVFTVRCKNGQDKIIDFRTVDTEDGKQYLVYDDFTDRINAEEALRESEERFRRLIETTKVGVSAIDEKGVIIYANERLSEMWGCPMDQIIRRSPLDFLDEENQNILKANLAKRKKGERESYEITWTRKDGTKVPTILSPTPIFDTDGRFKGSYGFITDITERKRMEDQLKRYAAELEQSNEEVKNFAYIVSHDLRVPLVNLKGYTSELRTALEVVVPAMETALPHLNEDKRSAVAMALHEDVPEALEFITNSVSRMDSFINSVLILSRLGRRELKPEPIDMNALVQTSLGNLSHQIQERGTTVTVESLPQVVADRTAIEQIMSNILGNAVKYLDPERPGQIDVTAQTNNGEQIFRISDNGRGIAQEDMHKVFAPFRRAGKQDTLGEGMGLAYVQTLVRRHNGRIWCESELGKGTTFTFTISNHVTERGKHVSG